MMKECFVPWAEMHVFIRRGIEFNRRRAHLFLGKVVPEWRRITQRTRDLREWAVASWREWIKDISGYPFTVWKISMRKERELTMASQLMSQAFCRHRDHMTKKSILDAWKEVRLFLRKAESHTRNELLEAHANAKEEVSLLKKALSNTNGMQIHMEASVARLQANLASVKLQCEDAETRNKEAEEEIVRIMSETESIERPLYGSREDEVVADMSHAPMTASQMVKAKRIRWVAKKVKKRLKEKAEEEAARAAYLMQKTQKTSAETAAHLAALEGLAMGSRGSRGNRGRAQIGTDSMQTENNAAKASPSGRSSPSGRNSPLQQRQHSRASSPEPEEFESEAGVRRAGRRGSMLAPSDSTPGSVNAEEASSGGGLAGMEALAARAEAENKRAEVADLLGCVSSGVFRNKDVDAIIKRALENPKKHGDCDSVSSSDDLSERNSEDSSGEEEKETNLRSLLIPSVNTTTQLDWGSLVDGLFQLSPQSRLKNKARTGFDPDGNPYKYDIHSSPRAAELAMETSARDQLSKRLLDATRDRLSSATWAPSARKVDPYHVEEMFQKEARQAEDKKKKREAAIVKERLGPDMTGDAAGKVPFS